MLKGDRFFIGRLLCLHHADSSRHSDDLGKAQLDDMAHEQQRRNNYHTRQQGDRRLFCDLGEIQLDVAAEDHIYAEYDRITDRQYHRSVGIAQQ